MRGYKKKYRRRDDRCHPGPDSDPTLIVNTNPKHFKTAACSTLVKVRVRVRVRVEDRVGLRAAA